MKILLALILVITATSAQATPMYYVFESKVLKTFDDFEYNVGESFTHTFRVDRDHGIFSPERNWYTYEMEFLDGPLYHAAKDPFNGGIENRSFARDILSDPIYNTDATTQFFYSSDNYALELNTNDPYNDGFLMSQNFDEYGDPTAYYIDLELLSFSVFSDNPLITPVPEPATMFLFSIGLAGIAGVRARQKNMFSGKSKATQ